MSRFNEARERASALAEKLGVELIVSLLFSFCAPRRGHTFCAPLGVRNHSGEWRCSGLLCTRTRDAYGLHEQSMEEIWNGLR
jgi:hypothetical protein